ncbi:uncharacterized protein LOC126701666 [Quercus robur]|uniref:uncharacterized protein LOC126701666 n=1 Tax=Quercus robur TaxID=38942 RepID=UPI0021614D46|nr:uncharacterized protein LOC126701666 [Quercus robur]
MNGGKSQSSREEDEAPRAQKQLKIGYQGQGKGIDTQSVPNAWLPAPMLHGESLMEDASMRNLGDGEGTYAIQATYRLEDKAKGQSKSAELERNKRIEAVRTLKNSEADLAKAKEDLTEMTRAKDNVEAGLAGAQKQAEDQTRHLLFAEKQLEIAKEQISDLKKKLIEAENAKGVAEWARDEAVKAKTEAKFAKTEAETFKDKAEEEGYDAGVAETQAILKAQIPGVCRLYCSQVWNEALKRVGVEASSDLWKAKSVFYPPAICVTAFASSKTVSAPQETEAAQLVLTPDEPTKGGELHGATKTPGGPNLDVSQEAAKSTVSAQVSDTEEAALLVQPL